MQVSKYVDFVFYFVTNLIKLGILSTRYWTSAKLGRRSVFELNSIYIY